MLFSHRASWPPTQRDRDIVLRLIFDGFARGLTGQVEEGSGNTVQFGGHPIDYQHAGVLSEKSQANEYAHSPPLVHRTVECLHNQANRQLLSTSHMGTRRASINTASQERSHP